ncbi:MAG TPA: SpoIVB peptidase S55 domain-containing protein, partial [Clostridia bacterium]|nr:SpoIVB peptidase S55 domain-containing protein [Clostridia bacterium]
MRSNRIKQSIGVLLSLVALIINYSPQVEAWRDLPTTLHMRAGQEHELNLGLPMEVRVEEGGVQVISSTDETLQQANSVRIQANEQGDARLSLSILGFPIRQMTLDVAPARMIVPGGQAIGVALMTDGVLVVGTSDLSGVEGGSPARVAGIRPGDMIRTINGVSVKSATHLAELVNQSAGKPIALTFQRKDQQQQLSVTPVMDRLDGQYRLGLWVRDSSAGVGTLSFYDPSSGRYGALGHAITDIDTGANLT